MRFLLILFPLLITSCVTPRVWVLSRGDQAGVIAYQNYNPRSDDGYRIKSLIPCEKFKMKANPIYGTNVSPTAYGVNYIGNSQIIMPLDGGYQETAEFHYECLQETPTDIYKRAMELPPEQRVTQFKPSCSDGDSAACRIVSTAYFEMDKKDLEVLYLEKGCSIKSGFSSSIACLILSARFVLKGQIDKAMPYFKTSCDIFQNEKSVPAGGCAFWAYYSKDSKLFESSISEMKIQCLEHKFDCYNLSALLSLSNQLDEALKFFKIELEAGFKDWDHLEKDPDFKKLRNLAEFKELVAKYKQP